MGAFDFISSSFHELISPLLEEQRDLQFINEGEMRQGCMSIVERYYQEGKFDEYAESGLEGRMHIADSFFNEIRDAMGIDTEFSFVPLPFSMEGGYDPSTNKIELNMNALENPDCSGIFNTILHEARHAFQHKAVSNPDSVSVDNNTIDTWRQNFENYISPWLDYEAYREQPVEADAFDYADNMVPENQNDQLLAQMDEEEENNNEVRLREQELLDASLI